MTKKERVLAVMKKEQVDMIPAGFWFHYKSDYTVQQMIDEHMKLFRTTDMDIIKIMQDYPYPISGKITCADDWYHIQVKGTDSEEFAKMAEIIRGIRKEAGKDVLIFQTMFGPFKAASMTFGQFYCLGYICLPFHNHHLPQACLLLLLFLCYHKHLFSASFPRKNISTKAPMLSKSFTLQLSLLLFREV